MNFSLILLFISAFSESAWNIYLAKSRGIFDWSNNILGVIFLLTGIFTFKKALSGIPLSIAIVIWSGLSLILTILLDVVIFKTKIDWKVALFMGLCIMSILGLNYYSKIN